MLARELRKLAGNGVNLLEQKSMTKKPCAYNTEIQRRSKEMLINSLCGRIAIANMPCGTRNLNIFLYMPRPLRFVRVSAQRQTLHVIYNFVLFCIILPHSELISVSLDCA